MKVKVNLVNQTLEYLDTKPYIQGTDSRNKLIVYVESVFAGNMYISYQLQNGRNTIKMSNSGVVASDSDDFLEDYDGFVFNAPSTLTSLAGNFMASLIIISGGITTKINVLNTVLDAVNFETYENALDDEKAEILENLTAMNAAIATKANMTDANQEVTAKKFIAAKEVKVNDSGTTASLIGDELSFNSSFEIKNSNTDAKIAVDDNIELRAEDITDFANFKINPDGDYLELYTTDNPSTPLFKVNDEGIYHDGVKMPDKTYVDGKVSDEATLRQQADAHLQEQIDGINAGQNLADIVADLTALANLPTTNLKVGDKVQVLVDNNHNNASTVYNWTGTTFEYIGKYGQDSYSKDQTYTKNEVNSLLNGKADKSNTYTKAEVDEIIHDLTIEGYAIEWETLCDIFNEVYADDPLMAMLDSINGV